MRIRQKKAQTELTLATLIGIILLALVITLMLARVYQEASSYKYDKKFLSMDAAMFIDALYASPNRVVVKYPQNLYDYSMKFHESKVTVFRDEETEALGESFPFTEEKKNSVAQKTISKKELGNIEVEGGIPVIFDRKSYRVDPFNGLILSKD